MCDERFARQYRYEPPSEFPQTSPCTGIVHHLSGPNKYANAQTSPSWLVGYWCKHLSNHFHCARKFQDSWTCTCVRLLGPCFKTGRIEQFSHNFNCQEGDPHPQDSNEYYPAKASQHNLTSHIMLAGESYKAAFKQPKPSFHAPKVIITSKQAVTHKARSIICKFIRPTTAFTSMQQSISIAHDNLTMHS